ncbi:hypothetical protein CFK41_13340 [Brachybacterium ginsengisoli]|uniref:YdhG-like domain-containing protein n=1 Tax=Brachybacterium ginsengisoli TaxID=1331682 RepID=A0A291GZV3_9MICO|nr:DUF1801 domain-containing protein [Brachybacterium ginsengisoli]ATG55646.1 hypothetical protein CFK41_13340 [Brachybacterium ginsengisoli]
MSDSDLSTPIADVPGVGRPAVRALAEQGLGIVGELAGRSWPELAALHGVGPSAGRRLQAVLAEHGASFQDPPAAETRSAVVTRGATGRNAADLRTRSTGAAPEDHIASLGARRRREGAALLAMFGEATGAPATMWGPSMIGYGEVHYRYATGREGDTFQLGFSPRAADLALYGLQGHPRSEELLERLGPHRRGAGCVWVRSLEAVDTDILAELVGHAWESGPPPA